ncbi:MAG: hypothetical protein OXQ31_27240 [Spirochaetaceae bacterium]|nr:hypothetical protein [Spirochaetaceae bacterium]
MHLEGNETRSFSISVAVASVTDSPDSAADSYVVRNFAGIEFFEEEADRPYKVYGYGYPRCPGGGYRCDDEMLVYGSQERLFVESPTRPFYLERDKDDLDLARIVITFVPNAESGVESPGE